MQKQDGNKNLLRSNTRNQRQQIEPRRDIENRGVRDKIYCKDAIENGGHYFFLQTTRLSSTRLPSRSLGEAGSTLSSQSSTLWRRLYDQESITAKPSSCDFPSRALRQTGRNPSRHFQSTEAVLGTQLG